MKKVRPTIIIDPNLQRIVRKFDINIDAYTKYLYGQGISPDEIKSMQICFTATGRFLSAGVYNFKTHKMQLSVPRARNVNQLLIHETYHAVEGMLGRISKIDVLVNRIFNVGVYAGVAVLVLAAVWTMLNNALNISQLSDALHLTFEFGIALFLIGGMAYAINPAERRAYAAQAPLSPFVKVVKKSFPRQLIGLGQILVSNTLRRS